MDRATLSDMIAKCRRKIEFLDATITELESELNGDPAKPDSPLSLVREREFYDKSQPEAVELLLHILGFPLSTDQIVECLEKGGIKLRGCNAKEKNEKLYTILVKSGSFGRAAKNTWGLRNWPGVGKAVNTRRRDEERHAETEVDGNTLTDVIEPGLRRSGLAIVA
jgi:hypothetical protein